MNRRGFLGRVGAIGAALTVAPRLAASTSTGERVDTGLVPLLSPGAVSDPGGGPTRPPTPLLTDRQLATARQTRLALLARRGLLVPCPNCDARNAWQESATSADIWQCPRCGWIDRATHLELPCGCYDCLRLWPGAMPVAARAERTEIEHDRPVGLYEVLDHGHPVTRVELNVYDLNTDGWLHHVEQHELARVCCGVRQQNVSYQLNGIERKVTRPDANIVVYGWHTTDTLEWKQQRGEAPQRFVHRCRNQLPRLLHSGQVCPYCGEVMHA